MTTHTPWPPFPGPSLRFAFLLCLNHLLCVLAHHDQIVIENTDPSISYLPSVCNSTGTLASSTCTAPWYVAPNLKLYLYIDPFGLPIPGKWSHSQPPRAAPSHLPLVLPQLAVISSLNFSSSSAAPHLSSPPLLSLMLPPMSPFWPLPRMCLSLRPLTRPPAAFRLSVYRLTRTSPSH
jgi:hypothetical protein